MKVLEIVRLEHTPKGVIGILKLNKQIFACTLEPPDLSNHPYISCIPNGQYIVRSVMSLKFGNTYEVVNIFGRSSILFHAGNTSNDTTGCILIGETIGKLKGNRAILNSGATFKKLMEALGVSGPEASLTITSHY